VAQTADVRPIEALHNEAINERAKRRVVVFRGMEVRPADRPQRVLVRVKLAFGERESVGRGAGDRHAAQPGRGGGARGGGVSSTS